MQKKIQERIIDEAMEHIDESLYREVLDKLIHQKIKTIGSIQSYEDKAKILRFAAQRGFSPDEIYAALSRIEKSDDG